MVRLQHGAGLGALWRKGPEGKYVTGPGSALNSIPGTVSGDKSVTPLLISSNETQGEKPGMLFGVYIVASCIAKGSLWIIRPPTQSRRAAVFSQSLGL